ncbi:MAG: hypothetical protein WBB39_04660 [Candidatus Saccharimonadales bacterium]
MKRNDVAIIILIASLCLLAGYFVGKTLLGAPQDRKVEVEKVDVIQTTITEPSKKVFNDQAINPAVPIQIGNSANKQPFNGTR